MFSFDSPFVFSVWWTFSVLFKLKITTDYINSTWTITSNFKALLVVSLLLFAPSTKSMRQYNGRYFKGSGGGGGDLFCLFLNRTEGCKNPLEQLPFVWWGSIAARGEGGSIGLFGSAVRCKVLVLALAKNLAVSLKALIYSL